MAANESFVTGAAMTSSVTSTDWACAFVSAVSAEVPNWGPSLPGANAYAGIARVPTMPAATVMTTTFATPPRRSRRVVDGRGFLVTCCALACCARSEVRVAGAFET